MPLRNQFFLSPLNLFHWNVNDYIELSCIGKQLEEKMFNEEGEITMQEICVGLEAMKDYDHITNSFVALVSDSSR